jgi:hypothetical protein
MIIDDRSHFITPTAELSCWPGAASTNTSQSPPGGGQCSEAAWAARKSQLKTGPRVECRWPKDLRIFCQFSAVLICFNGLWIRAHWGAPKRQVHWEVQIPGSGNSCYWDSFFALTSSCTSWASPPCRLLKENGWGGMARCNCLGEVDTKTATNCKFKGWWPDLRTCLMNPWRSRKGLWKLSRHWQDHFRTE